MLSKSKRKKAAETATRRRVDGNAIGALDLKSLKIPYIGEVIFFIGANKHSESLLDNIKPFAHNYKYFNLITYENALNLCEDYNEADIPSNIEAEMNYIVGNFKTLLDSGHDLTPYMIAQLLKIKLIHTIYKMSKSDRERKYKIKAFDEELHLLTKDCQVNDQHKQDKYRYSLPKITEISEDVSPKLLNADEGRKSRMKIDGSMEYIEDIVFDDDISKHICFYVFQGIKNAQIIKHLITSLNIEVTAIVNINFNLPNEVMMNLNDDLQNFWSEMLNYMYGFRRQKSFENIILMKYNTNEEDYEKIYQELIDVLSNIWKIKLRHLHYLRHTRIVHVKGNYPPLSTECLSYYENLLKRLPQEFSNESIVLNCLLQEVEFYFQTTNETKKIRSKILQSHRWKKQSNSHFSKNSIIESNEEVLFKKELSKSNYLVYEGNILELIVKNVPKNIGSTISNLSINAWKNTYPFSSMNNFIKTDDILHKHDRDPSSFTYVTDKEKLLHFMYIFLFEISIKKEKEPEDQCPDFAENLDIFSKFNFWKQYQVNDSSHEITPSSQNLYEPTLTSYTWKERLSSDVLMQEVMNANKQFQYGTLKYCSETDKYLLLFSDNLDEFGVNVKVFDGYLPTPVCLRDFCKFIIPKKSDWLVQNPPPRYYRKVEQSDLSKRKISSANEDYRILLSTKLNEESLLKVETPTEDEQRISFEELLTDLRNYPTNNTLKEECEKFTNKEMLNLYDIGGTSFVSVFGAITTFVSHDGVKLTVDNTKLIDEKPKCTVKLTCDNNDIILRSDSLYLKDNYNFHMNLADGTIITFLINDPLERQDLKMNDNLEISPQKLKPSQDCSNVNKIVTNLKNIAINSVDEDTELFSNSAGTSLEINSIIKRLKEVNNTEFYKINNNPKLINSERPSPKIPLINIIDRLLIPSTNNSAQNEATFLKRHYASSKNSGNSELFLDFRITLSNGLLLSCVPSASTNESIMEVKQEFLKVTDTNELYDEEFRLYSRNGFILVKKIDGTIKILKSCGDELLFQKPDSTEKEVLKSYLKNCHIKNNEDYKKKLSFLMNKKYGEDVYTSSRRGNIRTKKGYIIDSQLLDMIKNVKIPYKKISILKFNGHKTCIQGDKITQKHVYFLTHEHDYSAEEMYFERSDELRCLFDRFGRQSVQFSDGTLITTWPHVQTELVDGYVYISLILRYEHPKYVTVVYNFDGTLLIELNNDVLFTQGQKQNEYNIEIGPLISTHIDMKTVCFRKSCENCEKQYKCDFNIEPIIAKNINLEELFVHVKDTYDKKFYVDFAGNCQRDNYFVNRLTNNFACNHVVRNIYRQVFVFNKGYCGEQFWSEAMVETEKRIIPRNGEIREFKNVNGKNVLWFIKNVYKKFQTGYYNTSLEDNLMLSKNKKTFVPKVEYSTYRVLQKIMNVDEFRNSLKELHSCLTGVHNNDIILKLECIINNIFENCEKTGYMESLEKTKKQITSLDTNKCKCITKTRSMREKISVWHGELNKYKSIIHMNNIPPYFESQFCKITKN